MRAGRLPASRENIGGMRVTHPRCKLLSNPTSEFFGKLELPKNLPTRSRPLQSSYFFFDHVRPNSRSYVLSDADRLAELLLGRGNIVTGLRRGCYSGLEIRVFHTRTVSYVSTDNPTKPIPNLPAALSHIGDLQAIQAPSCKRCHAAATWVGFINNFFLGFQFWIAASAVSGSRALASFVATQCTVARSSIP